ncbi:GH116 family glycosyl hydrolase [Aquisphaera insulae]|uniref:GH116 family glycosyl hydrolase n=1 Tax=Aquisphaera insulae TaxID=2712864 RepID=UPI0013EAF79E|nr:GH116 family glycosyl hydrolase [Aquisphaera insulae]
MEPRESSSPRGDSSCASSSCGCGPVPAPASGPVAIGRRDFLGIVGAAAAAVTVPGWPAVAGPFAAEDFEDLVPRDKKLNPDWLRRLIQRGEPEVYRGAELAFVGMPVGGIGCGQLYLGGDGRLWYWDIFTSLTPIRREGVIYEGPNYKKPLEPKSVVEQGFAIRVKKGDETVIRPLDTRGFRDVSFRGEYPIGRVTYRDEAVPAEVSLEAFSPFIPLDLASSSLPATIMAFTVRNPGDAPVEVSLAGWLENAACRDGFGGRGLRRHFGIEAGPGGGAILHGSLLEVVPPPGSERSEFLFEGFEGDDHGDWKAAGTAFGDKPYREDERRFYSALTGYEGKGFANSHMMRHGEDPAAADAHKGTLTSREFTVERRFIHFRIGGGSDVNRLGLRLLVDGKVVRRAAGRDVGAMRAAAFDVREFEGKRARLQIADDAAGGWGHTTVDQIVFSDRPMYATASEVPGFGSMALRLLDGPGEVLGRIQRTPRAAGADVVNPAGAFDSLRLQSRGEIGMEDEHLVGTLGRTTTIAPGQSAEFRFVISWFFPDYSKNPGEMSAIAGMEKNRRAYAARFDGAKAVADHVAKDFDRLAGQTRLWVRTWYDSTLPHWFLDRTMIPVNTLATQTFHAFDGGRFWAWEGVDCCAGTCQHVWQYAQSVGRLFPAIERDLRERVDFGLAWHDDGAMDFRSENDRSVAHDGFCGTILRTYREHQMSPDAAFLKRLWPRVRKSLEFISAQDADGDGLLEGKQMNTLDSAWYGPMAWISSLYLAAMAAGAAMADEMGDAAFAARCRQVVEAGKKSLVKALYNGEYFIHKPPDYTRNNTNIGCHSDQMLGQSMAFQVGLPRVVPEAEARVALRSIWRYNFTPDVGPYREKFRTIKGGRWYAMPGEGGLLMTTFPKGGAEKATGSSSNFAYYFNECWTGFEYQVAAQMFWEGMSTEALAIVRMVHDRYHPARRNPYNEVECSDHYSRAMASHGAFLGACGFEHHGPKGHLGFAPRITPEDFRVPFTAADAWGTFAQKREGAGQSERVEVRWGSLRLKTLAFEAPEGARFTAAKAAAGRPVAATVAQEGRRVVVTLGEEVRLAAGETLVVDLS